jgi:hypothetical protein
MDAPLNLRRTERRKPENQIVRQQLETLQPEDMQVKAWVLLADQVITKKTEE